MLTAEGSRPNASARSRFRIPLLSPITMIASFEKLEVRYSASSARKSDGAARGGVTLDFVDRGVWSSTRRGQSGAARGGVRLEILIFQYASQMSRFQA